jgi:hypothetical protein
VGGRAFGLVADRRYGPLEEVVVSNRSSAQELTNASAGSDLKEPPELRVLENVIRAQAWDIEGLTQQRDESYEEVAKLEAALASARAEIESLNATQASIRTSYADLQTDVAAAAEAVQELRSEAAGALAEVVAAEADRLGVEPAIAAEIVLIRRSGLFDDAHYHRQVERLVEPGTDLLAHYVLEGEHRNLQPNVLFTPTAYIALASRRGYPVDRKNCCTALAHYIMVGVKHQISPSPFWIGNTAGANPVVYRRTTLIRYFSISR